MRVENKYKVGDRHLLIDLNKDLTNFKLSFECFSDPQMEFQICVTNQNELDSVQMSELNMKNVSGGSISGNIVADKNVYENYFLVLRANQDMEILVAVDLEPIEASSLSTEGQSVQNEQHNNTSSSVIDWKRIVMLVLLVVIFIVFIYYILRISGGHKENSIIDDIANHL